jgi:hypothetical protein
VKPLAFIAIRTESAGAHYEDIREIAVVRADAVEAQATDVYVARVRSAGGLRPGDESAVWLVDAMDHVRALSRGCVLAAFDVRAIRQLLDKVCDDWELLPLELATETVDLHSLAWPLLVSGEAKTLRPIDVCGALGVEVHAGSCVLDDVRAQADVYRHLLARAEHAARLAGFSADERSIVGTIVERLADGRRVYGPWRVDDGRNNPKEALAEVMDALNYCAAELVRLSKVGDA